MSKTLEPLLGKDNRLALKLLKRTVWLTFAGTLLFVIDRITSGAGSLDLVQNNMAEIRQEYATNTTFLTTVGALLQSFYLITLASYFYCGLNRVSIPRIVHIMIFSTFICEIINMVLSANRGALYLIATYLAFYIIFCARINIIKIVLSSKYLFRIALAIVFGIVSLIYFTYVAQHRVVDTTAIYLGQEASFLYKYSLGSDVDYAKFGAKHQLFYYFTHGFTYIDAIFQYAPVINFDFISPLGVRIESQIARFSPGYVFPAKQNIVDWVESAGQSRFGWPTIFGASLAYFGIIGSLIFFTILGYVSGYSTRRYLRTNSLGWLILVFTIFVSLNISFDWILRDFSQFMAIIVSLLLIFKSKKSLRAQSYL